jgi:hypothetical protein
MCLLFPQNISTDMNLWEPMRKQPEFYLKKPPSNRKTCITVIFAHNSLYDSSPSLHDVKTQTLIGGEEIGETEPTKDEVVLDYPEHPLLLQHHVKRRRKKRRRSNKHEDSIVLPPRITAGNKTFWCPNFCRCFGVSYTTA